MDSGKLDKIKYNQVYHFTPALKRQRMWRLSLGEIICQRRYKTDIQGSRFNNYLDLAGKARRLMPLLAFIRFKNWSRAIYTMRIVRSKKRDQGQPEFNVWFNYNSRRTRLARGSGSEPYRNTFSTRWNGNHPKMNWFIFLRLPLAPNYRFATHKHHCGKLNRIATRAVYANFYS